MRARFFISLVQAGARFTIGDRSIREIASR
jgi:hypothetical protein